MNDAIASQRAGLLRHVAYRAVCVPRAVCAQSTRMPGGLVLVMLFLLVLWDCASAADRETSRFGSSVHVISADMPPADIQRIADEIASRQIDNEFGNDRDALLFEPGVYGSRAHPLNIQVGYYTSVAGLGARPTDTVIHGLIQVRNRCFQDACLALDNFWRSVSNLTLDIGTQSTGCDAQEIWAVSQAAPARRLKVTGGAFRLTDPCSQPSFASGGFIADSEFDGEVQNGGQQQFFIRNSRLRRFSGSNWNQVFSGVEGELPECVQGAADCPYFALPISPVIREAPYLYIDEGGRYQVFRPALLRAARGTSWGRGAESGRALSLATFVVVSPGEPTARINEALRSGRNLLLTPGVYHLSETLDVKRDGTTIIGLGFPTLIPAQGGMAMRVTAGKGVAVSGLLFEAGPATSPVLVQIGRQADPGDAGDPTTLHDVFFRIGGVRAGGAEVSLLVNSGHTILDHVWAWRADHGEGVGWRRNRADTGLVVHGNHVTAFGLFVEHYQKNEVFWDGDEGEVVFFQNEMPYDPPGQDAWRAAPDDGGFPAFKVGDKVRRFKGYGWGSYSYFNQGVPIFAQRAFEVPPGLPTASLRDVFTIFLNAQASGGIRHVVNKAGAPSDHTNPDRAVRLDRYPP